MLKDVLNTNGLYKVDENCNIFRCWKYKMKPVNSERRGKYLATHFSVNGEQMLELNHIIVWEAFNGPKPEGYDIHHVDRNSFNNSLNNLSCITKEEHYNIHKEEQIKRRKGTKHSEQTKRKMSEARKGHSVSEQTRKKIGQINKGRVVSVQTRKRISQTSKGHKLSSETIAKRQQTKRLKKLIDPNYGNRKNNK